MVTLNESSFSAEYPKGKKLARKQLVLGMLTNMLTALCGLHQRKLDQNKFILLRFVKSLGFHRRIQLKVPPFSTMEPERIRQSALAVFLGRIELG